VAWLLPHLRQLDQHSAFQYISAPTPPSDHDQFEMVQTYGVVRFNTGDQANHVPGDREESALLGGDATVKRVGPPDGHASIVSCVSNLANTIIGSGKCLSVYFGCD
jgi:hypothetical protein